MIGPVAKTDAATARALGKGFQALPPLMQLGVLVSAVLVGVVGCSAAWIDQQDYRPSPQVCRADEVMRADCVRAVRPTPVVGSGAVR